MEQFDQQVKSLTGILFLFLLLIVFFFGGLFYLANNPETTTSIVDQEQESENTYKAIENGIHLDTGFVVDEGMEATIQNCTNCHSAKLVTQNRMSREGWEATIRWMQDTQNLWDLGNNEELILSYLAKNYAPTAKGRRQNLDQTEWYTLE